MYQKECVLLTLKLKHMVCFRRHNFPKVLLQTLLCVEPLEGRMPRSLEAFAWNHRASATHSCESHCFMVETQRDTLPSPMWANLSLGHEQNLKLAGWVWHACSCYFPPHTCEEPVVPELSTADWHLGQMDLGQWQKWLKPVHKANPGPYWTLIKAKASASDNWSFLFSNNWQIILLKKTGH